MALALDFLIFGNGHGLKSPYFDDVFFWLVDTLRTDRKQGRGALYNWIGGFGAQLRSRQWRMPHPGEKRRLADYEFVVFNARRQWLRVDVSWAWVALPKNIDEAHTELMAMKARLVRCSP